MQIWKPRWTLTRPERPIARSSYFGGLPTGLSASEWPQCGECDFWEPDEVAKRCMLLPVSEASGITVAPTVTGTEPSRVLPQLWVYEWEPSEDGSSAEVADQLTDPDRFWDVPENVSFAHGFASEHLTKAGGAPYWTGQGPSDGIAYLLTSPPRRHSPRRDW